MAHSAEDLEMARSPSSPRRDRRRGCCRSTGCAAIYALSPHKKIVRRAALLWGTTPILCAHARDTDRLVTIAEEILERQAAWSTADCGDRGGHAERTGATNFMRLHTIGDRGA